MVGRIVPGGRTVTGPPGVVPASVWSSAATTVRMRRGEPRPSLVVVSTSVSERSPRAVVQGPAGAHVGPQARRAGPVGPRSRLDLRRARRVARPPRHLRAFRARLLDVGFGTGEATSPGPSTIRTRTCSPSTSTRPAWPACSPPRRPGLTNVRLAETDVWDVLDRLPAGRLADVRVLFPDPWPKRRHHQRRLVQRPFVERVAERPRDGGWFHLATDWDDYAAEVRDLLARTPGLDVDRSGARRVQPTPATGPITPYEQRGVDAGRVDHRLVAVRVRGSRQPG